MNGIHDMGGMQDMGPIRHETNEPVFHAAWEGRVYAINSALRKIGKWNLDTWRHQIEQIAPGEYLRMTYYEKWLRINEELLVKNSLITPAELVSGKPAVGSPRATPALTPEVAARVSGRGLPSSVDPSIPPKFKIGQSVRARNINPAGHTRLPRYARGKAGTVAIDHGVHIFPDTHAHGLGEKRQHVYAVRFTARELWGEQASPRDSVHLDLWDDYLEPA